MNLSNHTITLGGINNMLLRYFSIIIDQHMLEVIDNKLDNQYVETDITIWHTLTRSDIINIICTESGIISWPGYGDSHSVEEWIQSLFNSKTPHVWLVRGTQHTPQEHYSLKQTCLEFIQLLDVVEVSDGGSKFYPNRISSCRVMDGERLNELLLKMKELTNE